MAESTLTKIQNELKAPKSQHNKFGNYDYRSAEDILEALKPLLATHNAQLTLTDKPVMVGEWHYIEATARLVVDDKEIANTASARESPAKKGMDDSQITGTASSYARKYALNGLFLIDDTKDADTNEYHQSTNQKSDTNNYQKPSEFSKKKARVKELAHEISEVLTVKPMTVIKEAMQNTKVTNDPTKWTLTDVTKVEADLKAQAKKIEDIEKKETAKND